jgi:hypothetical protein
MKFRPGPPHWSHAESALKETAAERTNITDPRSRGSLVCFVVMGVS